MVLVVKNPPANEGDVGVAFQAPPTRYLKPVLTSLGLEAREESSVGGVMHPTYISI